MEGRVIEAALRGVLREVAPAFSQFSRRILPGLWRPDRLEFYLVAGIRVGFDATYGIPCLRRRGWLHFFIGWAEGRIARYLSSRLKPRQALTFIQTIRAVAEVLEQVLALEADRRPGPELRVSKRLIRRKAQAARQAAAMAVAGLTDQQVLAALEAEAALLALAGEAQG